MLSYSTGWSSKRACVFLVRILIHEMKSALPELGSTSCLRNHSLTIPLTFFQACSSAIVLKFSTTINQKNQEAKIMNFTSTCIIVEYQKKKNILKRHLNKHHTHMIFLFFFCIVTKPHNRRDSLGAMRITRFCANICIMLCANKLGVIIFICSSLSFSA